MKQMQRADSAYKQIGKIFDDKIRGLSGSDIRATVTVPSYSGGVASQKFSSSEIASIVTENIKEVIKPWFRGRGGNVVATDPVGKSVIVKAFDLDGGVISGGKLFTIHEDTTLSFGSYLARYHRDGDIKHTARPGTYYIMLDETKPYISTDKNLDHACLAKVIIPSQSTQYIADDETWRMYNTQGAVDGEITDQDNGFIVSARDPFFDETSGFMVDDFYLRTIREAVSVLFADRITGSLRLSENLTITNSSGTLAADSTKIQFKNLDGDVLSEFGATKARVGGIEVVPTALQSTNFISGTSGFQITQDGDAEFNDVTVRGNLMGGKTSYSDTTAGFWIGEDSGVYKVNIGDASNSFDWDGSTLTVSGSFVAGELHIPDTTTANSFHVNTSGYAWWGCNVADFTSSVSNAPARVSPGGSAYFTAGNIGGWTLQSDYMLTGVNEVTLHGANKWIAIGTASWQDKGIQLQYNGGSPRAYIGDGANQYMQHDGTNFSFKGTNAELTAAGAFTASNATITGTVNATAGYFGSGATVIAIESGGINTGVLGHIRGGQTAFNTGTGYWLGYESGYYKFSIGNATKMLKWDGVNLAINASIITGIALGSEPSIQGWQTDIEFTASDYNTVAWTSGTIYLLDGTTYSIDAGNTGNISSRTYIYLDENTSETVLQTTTTASNASGSGKIMIASALQNSDSDKNCTFFVFGGPGGVSVPVGADNIIADTITANEIAANTITASEIAASTITANEIASNTITAAEIAAGTITTDEIAANTIVAGNIASGTITATEISSGTITVTELGFTPVQDTDVIAKINASAEGIVIDADNIEISGSTTFSSGYDPTSKVAALGGSYNTTNSGARVRIFPDANTGIVAIDGSANEVFKVMVGGTDVGDVTIGDYASDTGAFWDNSAATFTVRGSLNADDLTAGTLSVDRIGATSITAGKLNVATLSAISANLGTITAGTVTGGTIQTAATNARVVMNSDGIKWYDATTQRGQILNDGSGWLGDSDDFSWTTAGALTINADKITTGTLTGITIQTQVGNQSIVIDGTANNLTFNSSSTSDVLVIDDNVYGSLPGLKTKDGILYVYKSTDSANNYSALQDGTITLASNSYSSVIDALNTGNTANPMYAVKGEISISSSTTRSEWRFGVYGEADITHASNNDVVIGVYGRASTLGGGTAWAGYFQDGDVKVENDIIIDGDITIGTGAESLQDHLDDLSIHYEQTDIIANRLVSDLFPVRMGMVRNEELNNLLSTTDGTEITVTAINTTTNSITLSWVPYIDSLFSPTSGKEWALMNLSTSTAVGPSRTANYVDALKLNSGTYSTGVFTYDGTDIHGAEGNWTVGDVVSLYNPFETGWTWNAANPIITESGAGWRADYVTCGGLFQKSDGTWVILVNGRSGSSIYSIGAFSSTDMVTWTVLNSDSAIFTGSGSGGSWYKDQVFVSSTVFYLETEDRFIAYISGYNSTDGKWRIGWVKFDEDFSAGSIEYSSSEIIDSSGSSAGMYAPSVVRYGSRYRMIYTDRGSNANPDAGTWTTREAFSDTAQGPFVYSATVITQLSTNDGIFYSSHIDMYSYFYFGGRLYCLFGGTSRYAMSGTQSNRSIGLMYWDERKSTPEWVIDPRSPIFFNPVHGQELWGSDYNWCYDHIGGYIVNGFNSSDGLLYLYFTSNSGLDSYEVGVVTLDIQSLI